MRWHGGLSKYGDAVLALLLCAGFLAELRLAIVDRPEVAAFAVLATAPVAFRRRFPLGSFVALWVAMLYLTTLVGRVPDTSLVFFLVFFVSLYSLGAHGRGWAAWVSGAFVVAGIVLFVATDGDPFAPADVLFGAFLVGGPWAAGLAIRLRRERETDLTVRTVELEREQEERAREAVAAERTRIARELHDVVSHAIAVTVLQARGGRRMLDVDADAVREAFTVIEHTNAQALGDMRRLLSVLRDDDPAPANEPQPSLASLELLLDQVRAAGLTIELETAGDPAYTPPGIGLSAYRIVQEALTNVLKHAPGSEVTVGVRCGGDDIEVVVSDDGAGTASAPTTGGGHSGHGLIGMRERAAVAGGDFEAGPLPARGFRVRARLPYEVGV